ncbi:MAG: sulfite exporter TauE/SafE family protein [Candidatus Lambdaproteobacteria bacterium]|nr:sulfite exporter TauE/SafE family protein [Candidatus Lambdaproteobacteria bacterium]
MGDLPVTPLHLLVSAGAALLASCVGATAGAGLTAVLLPVLVVFAGVQQAVPTVTLALLTATTSRVVVHRRVIDYPAAGWFLAGSMPLAMLGTFWFTRSSPELLTRLLGLMLLLVVAWRRLRPSPPWRHSPRWFLPIGAAFGLLTGITAGMGPILSPFYLAYGLRKGAYVGTLALGVLGVHIARMAVFGGTGFLPPAVIVLGLWLIPFIVLGTLLGARLLRRLPERWFELIIEGVMVVSGLAFLLRGAG